MLKEHTETLEPVRPAAAAQAGNNGGFDWGVTVAMGNSR